MTLGARRTDYDEIASRYDAERGDWGVPQDDVVDELPDDAAVLDLGCGTGNYLVAQLEHFRGRPVRWFGLDPSAGMLEGAAGKVGRSRLVRGRAESIPFADGSLEYVFCGWVFHHFADKDRAIPEICRVLKPSGRLQIVNIDPWSIGGWWVYHFFPGTWEADQQRFWPVERLVASIEDQGLDVVVATEELTPGLPGAEVLSRARARVTSQLAILDDESYREGLERLEKHVSSDPDLMLENGSSRLRLTARKR